MLLNVKATHPIMDAWGPHGAERTRAKEPCTAAPQTTAAQQHPESDGLAAASLVRQCWLMGFPVTHHEPAKLADRVELSMKLEDSRCWNRLARCLVSNLSLIQTCGETSWWLGGNPGLQP